MAGDYTYLSGREFEMPGHQKYRTAVGQILLGRRFDPHAQAPILELLDLFYHGFGHHPHADVHLQCRGKVHAQQVGPQEDG